MTEPPPRKRFQIHLSTAIVMMFVAGGLIWANIAPRPALVDLKIGNNPMEQIRIGSAYGWPVDGIVVSDSGPVSESLRKNGLKQLDPEIEKEAIAVNIAAALTILFAVWLLCEWLIRRREARKGA